MWVHWGWNRSAAVPHACSNTSLLTSISLPRDRSLSPALCCPAPGSRLHREPHPLEEAAAMWLKGKDKSCS